MSGETRRAEWYARNRGGQKARMRDQARALKAELVARKGGVCCDCQGVFNPIVYHFDHRDPFAKVASVLTLARGADRAAFEAELEKCDLVCANCHAIRTSESAEVKAKITAGRGAAAAERLGMESVLGCYDATGTPLHVTVVGAIPAYVEHLAHKGLGARSVAAYAGDVRAFAAWARYRGLRGGEPLGRAVSRFIETRRVEGAASASLSRLRSSLSTFARFTEGLG